MPRLLSLFAVALLALPLLAQGFTPEQAVKRMTLPEGFSVRAVATEPMIRQPLSMSFDNRGRLWVLQYLQYPNPAGLKPVKQDQYLRTEWDKVPEAPPKGPKGLDRITICYDPDGNGVFKKSKDFVTGLNLACGFCLGHKRVYVVQPPYLLEYEDLDEDDVPDGDPKVLLTGFGMNDTHSLANNLQWGPDGWLYGASGSTSTNKIRVATFKEEPVEFQQGIWRYHVQSKRFELFSEGGGNTYGLDFDKDGQAIAGTNFGGVAMLHQRQGAYHIKGFSKHGPLHNPYAYGYFDHVPYKNFQGGHVTCGGIVYQSDVYPKEFRNQYIAGNLLSNCVNSHKLTPKMSSFTAEHGGTLLDSHDTWHRPVDLIQGPDGCVYVADWYDKRAAHLDPLDDWDKTNGRIYRIEYTGWKKQEPFDLRKKSVQELVELLKHENVWWRREARLELSIRPDRAKVLPELQKWLKEETGQLALEAQWAIYALGEVPIDKSTYEHPNEFVRAWAIRLAGDLPTAREQEAHRDFLTQAWVRCFVDREQSAAVLTQLACTAKRIRSAFGAELAMRLVQLETMPDDPAIPQLIWWAAESHVTTKMPGSVARKEFFQIGRDRFAPHQRFVFERYARRVAAEPKEFADNLLHVLLLKFSENPEKFIAICTGIEMGLAAEYPEGPTAELIRALKHHPARDKAPELVTRLLVRLGDAEARTQILNDIRDDKQPEAKRIAALKLLTSLRAAELGRLAPEALAIAKTDAVRSAAIAALAATGDDKTAGVLLARYPEASADVKRQSLAALLSRQPWAAELFRAFDTGKFPKMDVTNDHAKLALAFNDKALTALVEKHFGKIAAATPGEKRARIDSLNAMLGRTPPGDAALGKVLFAKQCAACHQLHGEGGKIGPDLTSAERKNRYFLLTQIVDPSAHIRPEFVSHKATMLDGRSMTGIATAQSAESLTLSYLENNKPEVRALNRKEIDTIDALGVSLMPDKLLDTLSHDEICHLFAYIQSEPAKPKKDAKYKIALISGSLEYKSDESLIAFQKMLEEKYAVECVRMFRKTDTDIDGLDKLAECDLAVFYTRRLKPDDKQLSLIKKYCDSGRPILGIRTASHGFQNWLEMDKDVYGGNYKNHNPGGPKCVVSLVEKQKDHPILKGLKPFNSSSSLYKNTGHAPDVTVLLTGAIPKENEPLAWTRERKIDEKTQRIFYTSLGHTDDFAEASFQRLVINAIAWCLNDGKSFAK